MQANEDEMDTDGGATSHEVGDAAHDTEDVKVTYKSFKYDCCSYTLGRVPLNTRFLQPLSHH